MRSLGVIRSPFPRDTDKGRPSDHEAEPAGPAGEFGPRGLIVRDPYASQLLNGQKIWDIRGRSTQIRGSVVIVKQGTGKAFGIANLVRVLGPLDLDDLVSSPEVPSEERDELRRGVMNCGATAFHTERLTPTSSPVRSGSNIQCPTGTPTAR
jgi:hypothetical protein